MKSPTKSCRLDHHQRLKDPLILLVPVITKLINLSLSSGIMVPSMIKQALITPPIKLFYLELNNLKNYRPVSNLHLLSKVLERFVLVTQSDFLLSTNQHETNQSAYRPYRRNDSAENYFEWLLGKNNDKSPSHILYCIRFLGENIVGQGY